jgi:signal transduction histidine kinase
MSFFSIHFHRRIGERSVLWGLIIGFGLVVVLLGIAGLVAVRDSHAIRKNAARLVQEQLLVARLLHEVQAEEDAVALIVHRIVREVGMDDRIARIEDLKKADRGVAKLAEAAQRTVHAEQWRKLAAATQLFSKQAQLSLEADGSTSQHDMDELISSHDVVVKLIHDLILHSTKHLAEVDQEIGQQLQQLADESAILLGACLLLSGVCATGTIFFVRHSIRRIEWQQDELSRVSWHMLQTQEETARRFSHELHDELGQSLAAVRSNLVRQVDDHFEDRRADCVLLVDQAIANVRELSQLLRPVILDDFGLDAGLRWLTEKFAQRAQVEMHFESKLQTRLQSELETHLFRIAQEAMTNIARHSKATEVKISLTSDNGLVQLIVEDNGIGLPPQREKFRQSLGLTGMRARARECGGTLELLAVKPHGLRVVVVTPIRLVEEPD